MQGGGQYMHKHSVLIVLTVSSAHERIHDILGKPAQADSIDALGTSLGSHLDTKIQVLDHRLDIMDSVLVFSVCLTFRETLHSSVCKR